MAGRSAKPPSSDRTRHPAVLGEFDIRRGSVEESAVADLLTGHLAGMTEHSPPESIHALPLDGFSDPAITLWCAWQDGGLLGCGALKELTQEHGEIKAMRTADAHLRRGVAAGLLRHILDESRRRGYRRVSLETGSADAFQPALRLYERFGFEYCGPFGPYREDPFSRFMTRRL